MALGAGKRRRRASILLLLLLLLGVRSMPSMLLATKGVTHLMFHGAKKLSEVTKSTWIVEVNGRKDCLFCLLRVIDLDHSEGLSLLLLAAFTKIKVITLSALKSNAADGFRVALVASDALVDRNTDVSGSGRGGRR